MDKIHLGLPIIVEGKYDKIRLMSITDDVILCTDGFRVFNNKERLSLIRRLGNETGILVLTDSDGAGKIIRRYLSSALPPEKIYHLYTPQIEGKEKRKKEASKEGYLGVEGLPNPLLRDLLLSFQKTHHPEETAPQKAVGGMTKADFFAWNLTGCPDATQQRNALCQKLQLPAGMNAEALLTAVNCLYTREELEAILSAEKEK